MSIYVLLAFQHSAFAIRMEGRLDQSPHFSKHIPRGELVELLSKALLYVEVEAHWKGDAMTTNCKTGFSLLEPHICSLDPKAKSVHPPPRPVARDKEPEQTLKVNGEAGTKRKADPPSAEDGHVEKRARRTPEAMDVDKVIPNVARKCRLILKHNITHDSQYSCGTPVDRNVQDNIFTATQNQPCDSRQKARRPTGCSSFAWPQSGGTASNKYVLLFKC
jgi:hypothetical protein